MENRILMIDFISPPGSIAALKKVMSALNIVTDSVSRKHALDSLDKSVYIGIIIAGGPGAWDISLDRKLIARGLPILAINSGAHWLVAHCQGTVTSEKGRSQGGETRLSIDITDQLFKGLGGQQTVWCNNHDSILHLPEGFGTIARIAGSEQIMAIHNRQDHQWGVQFHPESPRTVMGERMIENFAKHVLDFSCPERGHSLSFSEAIECLK